MVRTEKQTRVEIQGLNRKVHLYIINNTNNIIIYYQLYISSGKKKDLSKNLGSKS